MRILVTGGGGQVGTDLIRLFHSKGVEVSCFDLHSRPDAIPGDIRWVRGDVANAGDILECVNDIRPEVVYHFAAILSATGEKRPQGAYMVNMGGTYNVLEAARLFEVRQVMFASTIAVFGPGLKDPVPDDVPLQPTTMYGVTKVAGELLGAYYGRKFGVDFRGVRFPGLISAGIPGGGTTDYALWMYVDGIRNGHYECFVGPESSVPMMYMPDALRAITRLSEAPRGKLSRCIYNIAAFSPTAEDFANAVRARVPDVDITFKPDPVRQKILDSWPSRVDDTNARKDWGWKPQYDLDAMSDDLVSKLNAMFRG